MNLETTTAALSSYMMSACTDAYFASQTYGSNYFTTDGSALATQSGGLGVVQPDGTQVSESSLGVTLEDSNGNIGCG